MSGQISSGLTGYKGITNIPYYNQIRFNKYNTTDPEPLTIGRYPKVKENENLNKIIFNANLNAYKTIERKPNHFYNQQNKILTFIPPMYNDVYTLDTNNVVINKKYMPVKEDHKKDQYTNLRNSNLIDPNFQKYSTKIYPSQNNDVPNFEIYENRMDANTLSRNQKNYDYPIINQNKRINNFKPKYLNAKILSNHKNFNLNQIVPKQVNIYKKNLSPKSKSNKKFPIW